MTYWTHEQSVAAQAAAERRAQKLADRLNARQHPEQRANLQDAERQFSPCTNPQNAYTPQVGGPQPSLLTQLLSVKEVLEEALGVASTIKGQISGPQPGQPAMPAAPESVLAVVDHIDTLANALRRQLRTIQGRL